MARNIDETGIVDGQIVFADQVLQLTDALRGDDGFNLHLTENIEINDVFYPKVDGATSGSVLMTDGSGTTGFGLVQSVPSASYAVSASHASIADVVVGGIESASYAETASYAHFAEVARTSLDTAVSLYTQSLTVGSLNYTINHNLNFEFPIVQVYDNVGELTLPETVRTINSNTTFIRFSKPQNGTVVIKK